MSEGNSEAMAAFKEKSGLVTHAVQNIFKSMFSTEIQVLDIPPSNDLVKGGAVLSVISLVGELEWSVWLGLPGEVASGFTSEFLGETIPFEETEDIADAIGELSNMIAGDVKSKLSDQGIKTQISLPNVICGTNLSVLSNRDHPTIITRFSSSWGDFWVEVVAGVTEGETRAVGS